MTCPSSQPSAGSRTILLLSALLAATATVPVAGSVPEQEPPPKQVEPTSPWLAHSASAQGGLPEGSPSRLEPVLVDAMSLPVATDLGGGPLRSHVHGEVVQHQASDSGPGAASAARESTSPARPAPRVDPLGEAVGDILTNFDGQAFTDWIPPDTSVAVGTASVMEATNVHYSVFQKNGAPILGPVAYTSFFGGVLPAGWQGFLFDPRVVYHVDTDQFVTLVLGRDDFAQTSYFFVGVSVTGDPTGAWWIWRLVANDTGTGGSDADSWADSVGLGVDNWGIYVTLNLFYWTGGFKYATLHNLSPDMLIGGTAASARFWDLRWPSGDLAFGLQPAHPHSIAGGAETFFVNTYTSSGSSMALWKMTGDRVSSPTLTRTAITIDPYDAIGQNVDQPGSTVDLDGGDARVQNAIYANRRVWTTLTTDVFGDGTRSGFYLAKLDVDTTSVVSQALYHSPGTYYFYPAIVTAGSAADANVAVFVNWTQPDTTQYASGAVLVLAPDLTTPLVFPSLKSGEGPYERISAGLNRWGDHNSAAWDWASNTAWGAFAWATASNEWHTRLAQMQILDNPPCDDDGFENGGLGGTDDTCFGSFIALGDTQDHLHCDEDWVYFNGLAGATYRIETSNLLGGADTTLALHRGCGPELAFNDDFTGLTSRIDWTATDSGSYDVRIREFDDDYGPVLGYSVSVDCIASCGGTVGDRIGAYRPSSRLHLMDTDGSGTWNPPADLAAQFGVAGDLPLIGDWNGDGDDDVGAYRPATRQFLLDLDESGTWNPPNDLLYQMGANGDLPIIGDWNGDGDDEIGVYRPSIRVYLLDADEGGTWTPATDLGYSFGVSGDLPITGNW